MPYALTVLDGVRWDGSTVVGHRPRALLETLAAAGNGGCTADRLIDAVWGDDLPASPTKALQVLVSRVRAATDSRVVERTEHGYRLGLGREEVDLLAQADLVAAARAAYADGRSEAALSAASDALALGPDDQASGLLAVATSHSGDHPSALPLLERWMQAHPSDEEALACLLRSEAAVRGPGAALERYEHYRADLADRVGSDPGPGVQQAHRGLLAADRPVREGVRYDGTTLLGRAADVRELLAMLYETRVVSIVGAGGLGKTRLAHVIGRETERPIVHFVELVGVTTPEDVIGEVGSVLGIRDSVITRHALTPEQRADVRARIAQHLDSAPTLLILDNCEHVVEAAAELVAFLVATTRDLRVVTTTRAPLNIGAERVYALEQLHTPDAVELFRQRATAARPSVVLDEPAVTDVVSRLDGLPLAIELAAAKVRVMSVEDIGRRLENRFALLRGADRTAPDRHQTLLAVIDWSWNLLSDTRRRALRWLSVFHDGFTIEAAESLLGAGTLDSLEDLVHQSLLSVREDGHSVRYRMLETVREFGRMQLVEAGEDGDASGAQRRWARAYAHAHLDDLTGPDQFAAMDAVRAEEANLGDVLRQSLADPDPDSVVVLLAALGSFWSIGGEHTRIILLLDALDEALRDWTPPAEIVDHARITLGMALVNAFIGSPRVPERMYAQLKRIGPDSYRPGIAAMCKVVLAFDPAEPDGEAARVDALCGDTDRRAALQALQYRSHRRENDGDPEGAILDSERALTLSRNDDGPWQPAIIRTQLAQLHAQLGRHEEAGRHAQDALPVLDRLEADDDAIQARAVLMIQAMMEGRFDDADALFDQIERAGRRRSGFGGAAVIATARAELALMRGERELGLRLCREGIERLRALGFPGNAKATGLEPWTLVAEAVGLTAYALYGSDDDGRDLWTVLRGKVVEVLEPDRPHLDYPVVGVVLFGLGTWGLVSEALSPPDAVRLLVLADRFAYSRFVPTMSWANAESRAESVAPGLLGETQREYGERRGKDLLDDTRTFLHGLFG